MHTEQWDPGEHFNITQTGFILCMRPANERGYYTVTSSLIDWVAVHTQNYPCIKCYILRSCKVLKTRDHCLQFSNYSEIWHASQLYCTCPITYSIFLHIITIDYPKLTHEGGIRRAFCEFKIRLMFSLCHWHVTALTKLLIYLTKVSYHKNFCVNFMQTVNHVRQENFTHTGSLFKKKLLV